MSGWEDCEFCAGERGCPRASSGSRNCTASQCCKALTAAHKREAAQALDGPLAVPALSTASALPRLPPICVEIIEVLGVRECNVDELGPRSFYNGPEDDERCTSYRSMANLAQMLTFSMASRALHGSRWLTCSNGFQMRPIFSHWMSMRRHCMHKRKRNDVHCAVLLAVHSGSVAGEHSVSCFL